VGWLGRRDRRQGPRSPGPEREVRQLPTYIVEVDAPRGDPVPPDSRWHRRAVEFVQRVRYQAYPDHLRPFEDVDAPEGEPPSDEPLPSAIAERLPRPSGRKKRLLIADDRRIRVIHLEPFSLSRPDLWGRGFQAFLANAIRKAMDELDEGQP
jgi:hypothetical protein